MILGFFGSNERALALAIEAGEGVGQSPCEDVCSSSTTPFSFCVRRVVVSGCSVHSPFCGLCCDALGN